jgi:4-hydroxybenzoate polyprenyltransferase
MHPPTAEPPLWRRWAIRVYLTLRVSTLGFTLLLPLVGSASAAPGWRPVQTAWLIAIALMFHTFAYVLNDVIDLDVDRSEPLRADSPLVLGEIGRAQALALAWTQPPLAFGVALAGGASVWVLAWLGVAFVAMATYDVYGKRCPWPLVTDAVQAVGWCALLLVGAWDASPAPPGATWWLAGYVCLCVLLVNGVHGGLRDLKNDQRCGARTTALWFGARAGIGNAVLASRALLLYALALQAGLAVCALGAARASEVSTMRGSTSILVAATLVAAGATLFTAFRRAHDFRALVGAGSWNIVATVLVLPAVVWPQLGPAGAATLLAIFGLPVLAMWAYNGSHWHLAASDGPLP